MSNTFYEPDTKAKLGALWERLEHLARQPQSPLSAEQVARERMQWEHNAYAERCPLFASARSAATHRLVLPLEPNGVRPAAAVSEATSDPAVLYEWWQDQPQANVGVVVGRVGNLVALEAKDHEALAPS